jgi:hypothetical protein
MAVDTKKGFLCRILSRPSIAKDAKAARVDERAEPGIELDEAFVIRGCRFTGKRIGRLKKGAALVRSLPDRPPRRRALRRFRSSVNPSRRSEHSCSS